MTRLFAEQYKRAQAAVPLPKVLAMFGQLHMYRGRSEGLGSVFRYGVISRIANDCRSKYNFERLNPSRFLGAANPPAMRHTDRRYAKFNSARDNLPRGSDRYSRYRVCD